VNFIVGQSSIKSNLPGGQNMSMVKKSITLTKRQNQWIQAQRASGDYGSDSELIREALREKQMRMAEIEVIRAKLIEGEESGEAQLFDPAEFKKTMSKKYGG
jgi:antitoxin ParD1/3/4